MTKEKNFLWTPTFTRFCLRSVITIGYCSLGKVGGMQLARSSEINTLNLWGWRIKVLRKTVGKTLVNIGGLGTKLKTWKEWWRDFGTNWGPSTKNCTPMCVTSWAKNIRKCLQMGPFQHICLATCGRSHGWISTIWLNPTKGSRV